MSKSTCPLTPAELVLLEDQIRSLNALLPYANEHELTEIEAEIAEIEGLITGTGTAIACPMAPTPRQREFLNLECEEALYGGAAGGGKSEAGLMWLAQGLHLPDYSGIIFRRTYKQLSKSNDSLIAKAHRMYRPMGGKFNGTDRQWKFPSGAMIDMGALEHENSIYDYQGPSYHRVFFDELTQFSETMYGFLGTRIRRSPGYPISLGRRAASNPGGTGHLWVKDRFVSKESLEKLRGLTPRDPSPPGTVFWKDGDKAFVPARLADNPYLDFDDYVKRLSDQPPLMRERMMNGDWSITEGGVIKPDWLRYYTTQGDYYQLRRPSGELLQPVHPSDCQRFQVIDAAGTSAEVAEQARGKPRSWSVISTYDYVRGKDWLILRDRRRGRWDFPQLVRETQQTYANHRPLWVGIEDAGPGKQLLQVLRGSHVTTRAFSHEGKDKLARAGHWLNMLEQGKFFTSAEAAWREAAEAEWLSWTGHKDEQADQIDTDAYAAIHADRARGGVIQLDGLVFGRI